MHWNGARVGLRSGPVAAAFVCVPPRICVSLPVLENECQCGREHRTTPVSAPVFCVCQTREAAWCLLIIELRPSGRAGATRSAALAATSAIGREGMCPQARILRARHSLWPLAPLVKLTGGARAQIPLSQIPKNSRREFGCCGQEFGRSESAAFHWAAARGHSQPNGMRGRAHRRRFQSYWKQLDWIGLIIWSRAAIAHWPCSFPVAELFVASPRRPARTGDMILVPSMRVAQRGHSARSPQKGRRGTACPKLSC